MGGVAAGVDLGGRRIIYTKIDAQEKFLVDGLCEYPARATDGPAVCLEQICEGLRRCVVAAGLSLEDVEIVGLDTPGPASAEGVLSARGSTNFSHAGWIGFDIRGKLSERFNRPVSYLNDGNAAALWGHYAIFGSR